MGGQSFQNRTTFMHVRPDFEYPSVVYSGITASYNKTIKNEIVQIPTAKIGTDLTILSP